MRPLAFAIFALQSLSILSGNTVLASIQRGANLYEVSIRVSNTAPHRGTCQTPVWIGIHDGSFDASAALASRQMSEATNTESALVDDFAYSRGGSVDGVVGFEPICPKDNEEIKFIVNAKPGKELYFSYVSGIIPSNDAFITNVEPKSHLFFDDGEFSFDAFSAAGSEVLVADTDSSDDEASSEAVLDQMESEYNVAEKRSLVAAHNGLRRSRGRGEIAAEKRFKNADSSTPGYTFITVNANAKTVVSRVTARLQGQEGNRGVETDARGIVTLRFLSNGDFAFRVILSGIDNVLLGKMHVVGSPETDEEEFLALELFDGSELERSEHGVMKVVGEISSRGFCNGEFERLWQSALAGNVYVTVVTKGFPLGEVRGAFQ